MTKEWDPVYNLYGETPFLYRILMWKSEESVWLILSSVLPYFPEITGLFSAEAHYVQTEKDLQLSVEAAIDELDL